MSTLPSEDDALLDQQELLGHVLGDALVMLWMFRVQDALDELLVAQGLVPEVIGQVERVLPRFAVRTWYWRLRAPEAPAVVVALSFAAGNEGFVECNLSLAHPDALESPWATLEAHQLCAVPLVSAQAARDWESPGYGAVRLRVALDKATVRTATEVLEGNVLSRPARPWLAAALALILGYLEP